MLSAQYFRDQPHKTLRIHCAEATIQAEIVQVKEFDRAEGDQRQSFSVLLEGPPKPVLEQRIYEFKFGDGQAHRLFMVPIGQNNGAMRYEIVFS